MKAMLVGRGNVAYLETKYKHLLIYRKDRLEMLKVLDKTTILKLPLRAFKD